MGKDKRGDGTLDESENASVSRKQKREESPLVRMGQYAPGETCMRACLIGCIPCTYMRS